MSDQHPEEQPRDWMETWYETGDLPMPGPLSPEASKRILDYFDDLIEEQGAASEEDPEEG